MNKNSNNRRSRGRGGNKRHGNVRNQTFESNGPGVKVRGSAQQVLDKYLALARDASSSGDRIMAESYFQFAEHYFRLLNTDEQRNADRNGQQGRRGGGRDRTDTPGGAEGGPDDQMSGSEYNDDDGDSDGDNAEAARPDQSTAGQTAADQGDAQGEGGDSASEASGGDSEEQPKPARSRGRRKKPAAQGELPVEAPAEAQAESKPKAQAEPSVADDAAD
jgi:hypothetical protein